MHPLWRDVWCYLNVQVNYYNFFYVATYNTFIACHWTSHSSQQMHILCSWVNTIKHLPVFTLFNRLMTVFVLSGGPVPNEWKSLLLFYFTHLLWCAQIINDSGIHATSFLLNWLVSFHGNQKCAQLLSISHTFQGLNPTG